MKLMVMVLGQMQTNCYIVASEAGNAIVIDPGYGANEIIEVLKKNNLTLKKILLTHGHFDHVCAVPGLMDAYNPTLYIHKDDIELIADGEKCLANVMPEYGFLSLKADAALKDGDIIELDELTLRVMHTPGHSAGSVCFFMGGILFAGDTIFKSSIGRNDFYGSNAAVQRETLRKIAALEGDYHILSGHGEATTLAQERQHNPYLQASYYDANF